MADLGDSKVIEGFIHTFYIDKLILHCAPENCRSSISFILTFSIDISESILAFVFSEMCKFYTR